MPFGPWENFQACVRDLTKPKDQGGQGYDEETAKKVCGKLQSQLEKGSLGWTGSLGSRGNLIYGEALHPIKTYHPQEWIEVRVYLEEELKKAAETLADKPLLIDHLTRLPYPENRVLSATYQDGAINYMAVVSDEVRRQIEKGELKDKVSLEYDWQLLEKLNGAAPRGISFTGLSLLKRFEPGDPRTTLKFWESVIQRLKVVQTRKRGSILSERIWTRDYINRLPDSAFAIILPGGSKDEEGKTIPRDLRKFPHHNIQGEVDIPHLRNANARVPQSNLTEEQKAAALKHLDEHKRELGIEEDRANRIQKEANPSIDELIQSIEDAFEELYLKIDEINEELTALDSRIETLEKLNAALDKESKEKKLLEGVYISEKPEEYVSKEEVLSLLPTRIPLSWGYGPYQMIQRIRRRLRSS